MGLFKKNKKMDSYLDGHWYKKSLSDRFVELFSTNISIDESLLEDLLALLISSDTGIETSEKIMDRVHDDVVEKHLTTIDELFESLNENIDRLYKEKETEKFELKKDQQNMIMLVGVNGSGKTTSISKLANYYIQQGYSVGLIGADTFRAGAYQQIMQWAEKIGIECIIGKEKADPSSVITDGCRNFKEHYVDIIIADTAGRLQNKTNLMNELSKMIRVSNRECGYKPAILLTIDATTGQNGLSQAEVFLASCDIDGVILTKMDGTSKGGIVLAIKDRYNLPVVYMTYGENIEAITEFDIENYLSNFIGER